MLDRLEHRPVLLAMLIGIAALLLFAVGLNRPGQIAFDEIHYVSAARVMIDLAHPVNPEHPLLGKALIALGMLIFGDNPIGWRSVAVLAGALTIMGVFAFTRMLTQDTRAGLFAALFAMLGQMVFVQARIAMLDVFLGAFMVGAGVGFMWTLHAPAGRAGGRWVLTAMALGCAVGVKWAAIPYVALAAFAFVTLRWRRPQAFGGMPLIAGLALLGTVSLATYFATFLPAFFYASDPMTLTRLVPFQFDMLALQRQVLPPHPYQSDWWSWPLMLRPIWYFYAQDAGAMRGILLVGNPAIMWGGLVAVAACWWAGLRDRAGAPLAAALLWSFSILIWAVIPKSLGFYYYYYLPGIILCVVLAVAFHHWRDWVQRRDEWFLVLCLGLFVYFYPILAAMPLAPLNGFARWAWFPTWV